MRLRTSFCNRWRLLISAFLTMVFLFADMNIASAANKKEEKKKETSKYVVTGRDPKAFADASEMLAVPNQRLLDKQTANIILESLEKAIRKRDKWSLAIWSKKRDKWSPAIWSQLDGLRSLKMSATQIQSLQNAAQKMIIKEKQPSRDKSAAARRAFEQGNRHYEAGKLEQAIESYRSALNEYPAHWDAWNNMALTEMHRNNDLVALFLLSALTKSNPKYTGASINLSVCFKRLHLNASAYNVAADLAKKNTKMPMAQYNMAWFENSLGKYDSASGYLGKALANVDNYSVARWLRTLNTMESGRGITADELLALYPQVSVSEKVTRDEIRSVQKRLKELGYSPGLIDGVLGNATRRAIGDFQRSKGLPVDKKINKKMLVHLYTAGIPKIVTRAVKVAIAKAYSGDTVVAKIPKGSQLVISEESGDWCAVYWPEAGNKRRLWVARKSLADARQSAAQNWLYGKWEFFQKGKKLASIVFRSSGNATVGSAVKHGSFREFIIDEVNITGASVIIKSHFKTGSRGKMTMNLKKSAKGNELLGKISGTSYSRPLDIRAVRVQ